MIKKQEIKSFFRWSVFCGWREVTGGVKRGFLQELQLFNIVPHELEMERRHGKTKFANVTLFKIVKFSAECKQLEDKLMLSN